MVVFASAGVVLVLVVVVRRRGDEQRTVCVCVCVGSLAVVAAAMLITAAGDAVVAALVFSLRCSHRGTRHHYF